MDISKIDKNFAPVGFERLGEIEWYDIHTAPIKLYGAYDEALFTRLPADVAEATNDGVALLYKNTAGIRARLSTNSPFIALSAELDGLASFSHMTLAGSSGFDMYDSDTNQYLGAFMPQYPNPSPIQCASGAVTLYGHIDLYSYTEEAPVKEEMRRVTLDFPLYNNVTAVHIGIKKGCMLGEGRQYNDKKIVYYGSSITQGGCASRPGMCYQNIIERRNNCDYLNLGFSGAARGEDAMANYIASLDMDLFVFDYDHNAPNLQHLEATHQRFFKLFREKHPNTPVLFVSAPTVFDNITYLRRIEIIKNTYEAAISGGDKNVYFLNGLDCFYNAVGYEYTVDRVHPTDLGFMAMADKISTIIDKILAKNELCR